MGIIKSTIMKTISKKKLKEIEISVTESGFTLWITERVKGIKRKHWIIDGSMIKEDGKIRLGAKDLDYRFEAVFDEHENDIILIDKK